MHANLSRAAKAVLCAAVLAAALVAGASAARADVQPDGDPALFWNQVLSGGMAGSPATSTRGFAMVAVAIHEAVNATSGFPDYRFVNVAASGGDTRAATAVAAYNLLTQLNPGVDYSAAYNAALGAVPNGAAKTQGMQTGAAIAQAVLNMRLNDGSAPISYQAPAPGVGVWVPGVGPIAAPQWGGVTPWVMNSPDQFRPAAPVIGSPAYVAAYQELLALAAPGGRTQAQIDAANMWAAPSAGGLGPWIKNGVVAAEGANLSTIENARLFATLAVAAADATIGIFDAKYEYEFWRPATAFAWDGIGFTPIIATPNHPSFVSGHSGQSMAAATILQAFLGDAVGPNSICFTGAGMTHCFSSFTDAAIEASNSRVWGGIHWRFDTDAGLLLGSEVANYTLSTRAFDAVPEPATWAMMIMGFGLAGALLRRRSRRSDFAAA